MYLFALSFEFVSCRDYNLSGLKQLSKFKFMTYFEFVFVELEIATPKNDLSLPVEHNPESK